MEWMKMNIPWEAEPDDIALRIFFFYFIGSYLFSNNQSVLTCKLLGAMRAVSDGSSSQTVLLLLWILHRFP